MHLLPHCLVSQIHLPHAPRIVPWPQATQKVLPMLRKGFGLLSCVASNNLTRCCIVTYKAGIIVIVLQSFHTAVRLDLFLISEASLLGSGVVRILSNQWALGLLSLLCSPPPHPVHSAGDCHWRPPHQPFPALSSHRMSTFRVRPNPLILAQVLIWPVRTEGLFENALPSSTREEDARDKPFLGHEPPAR